VPLQLSPIKPRDAFVYFDDSRCRGADLKLSPGAVALLTVGVKMCKDKLMQAAGRMRALGKGQKVQLLGGEDIAERVRVASGLAAEESILAKCVWREPVCGTLFSRRTTSLLKARMQ
jgi:hypothetical protein